MNVKFTYKPRMGKMLIPENLNNNTYQGFLLQILIELFIINFASLFLSNYFIEI